MYAMWSNLVDTILHCFQTIFHLEKGNKYNFNLNMMIVWYHTYILCFTLCMIKLVDVQLLHK